MKKSELYIRLTDLLLEDEPLADDVNLSEIMGWDSMSQMAIIAFFDEEFSYLPPQGSLGECESFGDIISLVEDKLDEG